MNDQFMAGKAAMQQNGVWNLSALEAKKINFGVVPIPKPDGGAAPGPMGGEVLTIPSSGDTAKMQAAGKVVNCLLSDKEMLEWATLQAYIPSRQSVAAQSVANDPNMKSFVDAAAAELSRTGPPANLGPNYSKVSQPLWNAIQAALSGAKSPQDALTVAQQQAASALPAGAPPATAKSAPAAAKVTEWDYQSADPQMTQWQKVLDECTASTGITIDQQAVPRDDLIIEGAPWPRSRSSCLIFS